MSDEAHLNEQDQDLSGEVQNSEEGARPSSARPGKRSRLLVGATALVALSGAGAWAWGAVGASQTVATDNAYVAVEAAQVSPLTGGAVAEVRVVDTQRVARGDILVVLDSTDARLAVRQAEAALSRAERQVRQLLASDGALAAQADARTADINRAQADLRSAQADLSRAEAELRKARIDLQRREALSASGAVSGQELTDAQTRARAAEAARSVAQTRITAAEAAAAQARANREAAQSSRRANQALIADGAIETNPEVLAARARLEQARVDLARTVVRAPADGVIVQRAVEIGQRVQPGARLMTIVPLHRVYVDANFKEVELRRIRVGQPVELTADIYGGEVIYQGRVAGVGGGTGSAFSILPPQNATGNWTKTVQRLPVRIVLEPEALRENPLRVGLSMRARVDVSEQP